MFARQFTELEYKILHLQTAIKRTELKMRSKTNVSANKTNMITAFYFVLGLVLNYCNTYCDILFATIVFFSLKREIIMQTFLRHSEETDEKMVRPP